MNLNQTSNGFSHRFMDRVHTALSRGMVQCFLYGESLGSDWFYNVSLFGIRDLRQSLVRQLLFGKTAMAKVVILSKKSIDIYEPPRSNSSKAKDPRHRYRPVHRKVKNRHALVAAVRGEVRAKTEDDPILGNCGFHGSSNGDQRQDGDSESMANGT